MSISIPSTIRRQTKLPTVELIFWSLFYSRDPCICIPYTDTTASAHHIRRYRHRETYQISTLFLEYIYRKRKKRTILPINS